MPGWSETLLSRVEDAGINASAPPQQRWVDGWLLRFSPGKAKRARCVQAVAAGRLPLQQRLGLCQAVFEEAGLPMLVRITPFSQPPGLDGVLAGLGYHRIDDTRVMVAALGTLGTVSLPAAFSLQRLEPAEFAQTVGALRGSPAGQRAAQAQRLLASPVPYQGWVLRRTDNQKILVCGQVAAEAELVGLYDVFTDPAARGQGLAGLLCAQLLAISQASGAQLAYLQVEGDNTAARAVYHRLGFADAYAYHYRTPVADAH